MSTPDPGVLATRALGIATETAGKDAEVSVDVWRRGAANVRFARNEPTTSGEADETQVAIRLALGRRVATSSTNQSDDASLRALATRVLQIAKLAPEDPEHMPLLPPQTYASVPSAYDNTLAAMGPKERAAIAERAIARADEAKVRVAGFFERAASERVIQTSTGLVARHAATDASYTVTARTADDTGSGWAGREAHRAVDIEDEVLATSAIDKAVRSAQPRPLPPGRYTVVLEPQAVFEMVAFMIGQMDQRAADEGRVFFAGKAGKKLFPDFISLRSDPASRLTPGAPFDGEGSPLAAHPWVSEGKVGKLAISRYWAAKKGLEATGSPSVFALSGGRAETTDELVRGVKRGLLVTRFWYIRMLEPQTITVTGLTRDGLFLIENGKITAPVANFRFNESPVTMLKNAEAMTRQTTRVVSYGGVWQVPAIRAHDFTMASPSAAV